MVVKKLSLVKYAGEYWFTLSDFAQTRDTTGYSDSASVKSAVRTFVVKSNPDKYIAFRGEQQLKNIIAENKDNPLFVAEDFSGTRTALIHWEMLEMLRERFAVSRVYKSAFNEWVDECVTFINNESEKREVAATTESVSENPIEARSIMLKQMRTEYNRMVKDRERLDRNIEKLANAISAIEAMEVEE